MNFIGTKTLKTKRLILRKFSKNDLNDFYEYASNYEITKFLTWNPHKSIKESQNILENIFIKYDKKTFPVNPKIFTCIQTANVCFLNSTGLILLSPVLIRTLL